MTRKFSALIWLAGAAAAIAGCSETVPSLAPVGAAPARAVSDQLAPVSPGWNAQARVLIGGANMSPLAASRVLSALGVAQYRAVLAVDNATGDVLPSNGVGAGGRANMEARRGAVAGASSAVLSFLFASAAASLEERVALEGEAAPGNVHPQYTRGVAMGRAEGAAIVERLKADKFTTPWTGTVPTGPGKWVANGTPAGATFGGVTPWFMTSGSQFRPAEPPAFQSGAFNADLAEIKSLALNRTEEQRAIALFWNLPTGTHTPVGYWNEKAAEFIASRDLNERAAAHVMALMNAAIMDALIGCWEAKYHYWVLRPSQADPSITLTFGLPNHPSYPSGHSCVSASAATVLSHFFPERSDEMQSWVAEGGLSRMYAGIHYRFDITAGNVLGVAVGQYAIANQDVLR